MDPKKVCKNVSGVTLIELVIALAVASVIGGCVLLAAPGRETGRLAAAGRTLRGDFRYAQRMAVITGRKYRIELNIENNYYIVYIIGMYGQETVRKQEMPEGVWIEYAGSPPFVTFYPWGTPDRGITVRLDSAKYYQKVTVLPSGGRAELYGAERKLR